MSDDTRYTSAAHPVAAAASFWHAQSVNVREPDGREWTATSQYQTSVANPSGYALAALQAQHAAAAAPVGLGRIMKHLLGAGAPQRPAAPGHDPQAIEAWDGAFPDGWFPERQMLEQR